MNPLVVVGIATTQLYLQDTRGRREGRCEQALNWHDELCSSSPPSHDIITRGRYDPVVRRLSLSIHIKKKKEEEKKKCSRFD